MDDHYEGYIDDSFIDDANQLFTSFQNLSLNNCETINNHESSKGFIASSFNEPTQFIPFQNSGFLDEEFFFANQYRYNTVENNPFAHMYYEDQALVPCSSGAVFGSLNGVGKSDWSEYQDSSTDDGSFVKLAMSSQGSCNLQLLLQKGRVTATYLLQAMYESLVDVMTNRFGHHVFNRIVDYLNYNELARIIIDIRPILVDIACSEYGSYVIQKLITVASNDPTLTHAITSTLSSDYFQLMTCRKGRHTVEHCLTILQSSDVEVIYEATMRTWFGLATDRQGCISLNFCIDCLPPLYQCRLLLAIAENSINLAFDSSGTFVLQHVLRQCDVVINNEICGKLKGAFVRLSRMQHGSHLVQKCLFMSSLGIYYFATEVLQNISELKSLVQDQFGNYVIQTALEVSQVTEPAIYFLLRSDLQRLKPLIGKTQYALHVFKSLN